MACIKGYMPKPRSSWVSPQHYVADRHCDDDDESNNNDDDEDDNEGQGMKMLAHNEEDAHGSIAKESSRGIDLNPSRYADAARRAGRTYIPPHRQMNGQMNVYKAGDPVDNMPSYSLMGTDSRREMGESVVSQYRPRSTVGAASQDDGMPAFHIAEEQHSLNEYEKHYDDELGGLNEMQGLFPTAGSINSKEADKAGDDETFFSDDWLDYIDTEIDGNKNENMCKEDAS